MKKLFFTLCALCLCGTMWAEDTYGDDIQKDAATGLYFATVTYDNATTNNVIAIIPAQDGDSYSIDNLVKNDDGTYTLPATVQADGGEEIVLQGVFAKAFASVLTDTSNPIHLIIPANIIDMGQNAFQYCTQIEEVTVEYSATALDEAHNVSYGNSFSGCSNLKVVTQNRDITIHRNNAQYTYICFPFADLPSIETVYIGEKVTSLANNAYNARTTCQLSAVYCYATDHIPTLANQCFLYLAEDCTLYVYDELVETFKADVNGTNGWGDIFTNIQGMGSAPLEEGTYQDVTTGLFFEINEDGTASIYHDEAGVYSDDNLIVYSYDEEGEPNAYTLPEEVEDENGVSGKVNRIEANAFSGADIQGHLVIPSYINALGINAFANCTGITEVTFEYSETPLQDESNTNNLGTETFLGCTNVATVNLYRDIDLSLTKSICGPFCTTYAITTLNIGPRVTELGDYMFHYAFSTSSTPVINCYVPVPFQLGLYSFDTGGNYTFYVPNGAATAYSTLEAASSNHTAWNQSGTFTDMSNAFAITTHDNNDGTAYATFYNSASDVELFDGELTAYVAYQLDTEDDGLYIEIESIGNTIPASTGVIVETEEAGTYLAIATGNTTSFTETNDLYGYDEATEISNPSGEYYYYLLSSYNDVVGFYWGADEGGAFECQAHRAYLALLQDDVKNNANQISIRKGSGEDTTGISSVESATEGATVKGIYTVQGVRVSNMNQPGLYIVDGKKVLVK